MAELEKQVRRVMHRLNFQRYVEILVWCWVAALTLALCWIVAEKIWHPVIEPWWVTVVGSLGLGVVVAGVIWFFTRPSRVDAALAMDQAFGLKERVSTTLTLPSELRETSAGMALIGDATKRVETLDVAEKFAFQLPRTAWLPLLPAILVFLVATFVQFDKKSTSAQAKTEPTKQQEQIKEAVKVSTKRFEQQKEKAKEQGFAETEKLLAELAEKAKQELAEDKNIDQKKALAKTSSIQDALKERREKLGSAEQLQKQLEKLKATAERGPADKFHEALKQGDFKKAAEELSKMAEQMKSGQMTPEQKKALEKQLAQMKEQLEKLGNVEERKKQLEEQLKKAGMPEEMIKKELAKLDAEAKQMEQLKDLAQKLGKVQEALAQGDMDKALESMQMSKADLENLMKELQELEMIQNAMNEIADMKNAMVCRNCSGAG